MYALEVWDMHMRLTVQTAVSNERAAQLELGVSWNHGLLAKHATRGLFIA